LNTQFKTREMVNQLKKERKRRIKIRVVPNEGYNIDAELEKETSIEDVLSTLKELGFKYSSDEETLGSKPGEDPGKIIVENIYSEFQSITKDYGLSIKTSEEFYDNWLKLGFDIVDLKHALGGNTTSIGDASNSGTVSAAMEEEPEEDSHNTNASLSPFPEEEKPSPEHSVDNTHEEKSASEPKARSLLDDPEPVVKVLEVEEGKPEIRPVFEQETSDRCKFCSIFRDMGNVVCPNCGRALNLKHNA
jgi:hypothetical protein